MAKVFDEITDHMRGWIARQPLFFVASAPLAEDGHVNVSPKGPGGSLAAHLRENGRICVMFCAFQGPPRIVRLHGRGEAVLNDDPRFEELYGRADFADPSIPDARRSMIVVDVTRISDSCGYGVPVMSVEGSREHHALSSTKKVRTMGADGYEDFQRTRGARSVDGLPALAD